MQNGETMLSRTGTVVGVMCATVAMFGAGSVATVIADDSTKSRATAMVRTMLSHDDSIGELHWDQEVWFTNATTGAEELSSRAVMAFDERGRWYWGGEEGLDMEGDPAAPLTFFESQFAFDGQVMRTYSPATRMSIERPEETRRLTTLSPELLLGRYWTSDNMNRKLGELLLSADRLTIVDDVDPARTVIQAHVLMPGVSEWREVRVTLDATRQCIPIRIEERDGALRSLLHVIAIDAYQVVNHIPVPVRGRRQVFTIDMDAIDTVTLDRWRLAMNEASLSELESSDPIVRERVSELVTRIFGPDGLPTKPAATDRARASYEVRVTRVHAINGDVRDAALRFAPGTTIEKTLDAYTGTVHEHANDGK